MQEWKEKRQVLEHYDREAEIYDVQYFGEQKIKIEYILKSIKIKSKDLVLDLGCGTGFLFQQIRDGIGFFVGLDISVKSLQKARNRVKNISNVYLVRGDADNIPFPDKIFDKIFAITVLQNMPDPIKTIIEIKRSGKAQAIFILTGLKKKFTLKSFIDLLEKSELKMVTLNSNELLKGNVVVCINTLKKP
jgi:demethylmenaquinone methyltransferase/2-methoxy-6-polyprenyl-1,4-benzoquinol methylase